MGEHHSAHYLLDKPSESDYEMVYGMLSKAQDKAYKMEQELTDFLFGLIKTEGMPEAVKKAIAGKLVAICPIGRDTRLAEIVDFVDDVDTRRAIAYTCATANGFNAQLWKVALLHGNDDTKMIVSKKLVGERFFLIHGPAKDVKPAMEQMSELLRLVVVCCPNERIREGATDRLTRQMLQDEAKPVAKIKKNSNDKRRRSTK